MTRKTLQFQKIANTQKEIQNRLNELKVLGQHIWGGDIATKDLQARITGIASQTDILLTNNDIVAETNDDVCQVQKDFSNDNNLQILIKIKIP